MCSRGWREAFYLGYPAPKFLLRGAQGMLDEVGCSQVGLKAQVALSSQSSLLPFVPITFRVLPRVLLLPMGLKHRIKSAMEGLNQRWREPQPPDMPTVSHDQPVGHLEGIQRGMAVFAWEFLRDQQDFQLVYC